MKRMPAEYLKMFAAMEALASESGVAILATVVRVSGSAYRSIGARMLMLPDGQRIGAVSGGCIEGEIAKKGWWWTESGAYLRCYDTTLEGDGHGLACNGSIEVLVERVTANAPQSPLTMVKGVYESRVRSVMATAFIVEADGHASRPQRLVLGEDGAIRGNLSDEVRACVLPHMRAALEQRISCRITIDVSGTAWEVVLELAEPPLQLIVCGAGVDAVPLVKFAAELGWRVIVCDGRADFAKSRRFPEADRVFRLRTSADLESIQHDDRTACVIMTHSHEQDSALLAYWLPLRLSYLGVLGARSRTQQMLDEVDLPFDATAIYSPAGLDIGSDTPEEIALSIVAEIRACFANRSGAPLRERAGSIHVSSAGSASTTSVAL